MKGKQILKYCRMADYWLRDIDFILCKKYYDKDVFDISEVFDICVKNNGRLQVIEGEHSFSLIECLDFELHLNEQKKLKIIKEDL